MIIDTLFLNRYEQISVNGIDDMKLIDCYERGYVYETRSACTSNCSNASTCEFDFDCGRFRCSTDLSCQSKLNVHTTFKIVRVPALEYALIRVPLYRLVCCLYVTLDQELYFCYISRSSLQK